MSELGLGIRLSAIQMVISHLTAELQLHMLRAPMVLKLGNHFVIEKLPITAF